MRPGATVRAENLDSAILVMKAAENRARCDGAEPLNRPMNGSVLAQSSMSPRSIVIGDKLAKDPAQMGLTSARADHSGLMPANLITLVHFSIFSAMNLANSLGEFGGTATTPRSANRC